MSDMTPSQLKAIASALSDMGRYGDTELVHVNQREIDLLKQVGAGTRNPQTGLLEFYDPWDPISSTTEDALNYKDPFAHENVGSGRDDNKPSEPTYTIAYRDDDGNLDPDKSPTLITGNSLAGETITGRDYVDPTKFTGLLDYADGGGPGKSGEGVYGNRYSAYQVVDGILDGMPDGRISKAEAEKAGGLWGGIDGDNDSPFTTISNIVGFVANPVGYVAGMALKEAFTGGFKGSGSTAPADGMSQFERMQSLGGNDRPTGVPEVDDAVNAADDAETSTSTYSEVTGNYGYNKFSNRNDGRKFLNYDYTGGKADVTGSYTEYAKPFQIAFSMDDSRRFAFTEGAANAIDQMVSQLDPDVMQKLNGSIHVYATADDKIAVVIGNDETGFIEATYDGSEGGAANAMNDVANMLAYVDATGDATIDAGFMGRVASADRFGDLTIQQLSELKASLQGELDLYDDGTPQYRLALERMEEVERELSRRNGAAETSTVGYSEAAGASIAANTAQQIIANS